MSRPLFTVVVPTYRRPALLAEALASIQAQTVSDFECIVVDDASGEEVTLPDDPRFRLLRRETGGSQAGAINTGIDDAEGEWVCFLDDDDIYEPRRLELTVPHFDDADIICVWGGILGRNDPNHSGRRLEGFVLDTILDGTTPQLGMVTVRRARLQHFDDTYPASADLEWWLRMAVECRVVTVPVIAHRFRIHKGPRVRNSKGNRVRSSMRLIRENPDYFRRNRRALAYRYRRAAASASSSGDQRLARRLLLRSLRIRPDARAFLQLLRTRERSTNRLEDLELPRL